MLENTSVIHGQTAPKVRFCHAQIPSSFGQDGSNGNVGRTAESSVFNILPTQRLKTPGDLKVSIQEHDMTTQVATISATPDLKIIDGQITTTSQQIAAHFNKVHRDVVRAIENIECSAEFRLRNFAQSSFEAEMPNGGKRKHKSYRLTRDGFVFLAMGFTGKDAAQWKEAYITAFNKMEAELLARTTRPHNPSIDYDRISPAQAQDLKEIVAAIVQAGIQGYGETWARFQRKFKVNSYLELPATQHLEARQYLIAKLPNGNAATVAEEKPTAPTMFGRQWLVSTDMQGRETVRPVAPDQFVKSFREIARGIAVGDMELSTAELIDLASACNQRLVHRLGNPALVLAV